MHIYIYASPVSPFHRHIRIYSAAYTNKILAHNLRNCKFSYLIAPTTVCVRVQFYSTFVMDISMLSFASALACATHPHCSPVTRVSVSVIYLLFIQLQNCSLIAHIRRNEIYYLLFSFTLSTLSSSLSFPCMHRLCFVSAYNGHLVNC